MRLSDSQKATRNTENQNRRRAAWSAATGVGLGLDIQFDASAIAVAVEKAMNLSIAKTFKTFGSDVARDAKTLTPRQTGNNARSITSDVYLDGAVAQAKADEGYAGSQPESKQEGDGVTWYTQSKYGAWLELGTKRMGARPYLYPAFVKNLGELRAELEGSV